MYCGVTVLTWEMGSARTVTIDVLLPQVLWGALWQVLRLLGLPEADMRLVTKDRNAARIHVSFMGKVFLPEALRERIADSQWTHVVAFRPTGDSLLCPS